MTKIFKANLRVNHYLLLKILQMVMYFASRHLGQVTRCITPKRVTSRRAHLRVIAPAQNSSFRKNVAAVASRWQTVSDLTGPKFKPQTFRSRDERVTVRSTGW